MNENEADALCNKAYTYSFSASEIRRLESVGNAESHLILAIYYFRSSDQSHFYRLPHIKDFVSFHPEIRLTRGFLDVSPRDWPGFHRTIQNIYATAFANDPISILLPAVDFVARANESLAQRWIDSVSKLGGHESLVSGARELLLARRDFPDYYEECVAELNSCLSEIGNSRSYEPTKLVQLLSVLLELDKVNEASRHARNWVTPTEMSNNDASNVRHLANIVYGVDSLDAGDLSAAKRYLDASLDVNGPISVSPIGPSFALINRFLAFERATAKEALNRCSSLLDSRVFEILGRELELGCSALP